MRIFQLDNHVSIVCDWKKTRMAFKHEATLLIDGKEQDKTKICYQNRTWESYEYQSVLIKMISDTKILTAEQKALFLKYAHDDHTDWSTFKSVANIAKIGEIFCDNTKDKNDWKDRMIKAGFGNSIQIPEDWETLSDTEKEDRLNQCIRLLENV